MNTVNEWKTVASATKPERRALWEAVFGKAEVPIISIVPKVAVFPGVGEQRFYEMDLKAITPEQKQKLVESIAHKFGLSVESVAADIDAVGVPVLASEVIVSTVDFGQIANIVS